MLLTLEWWSSGVVESCTGHPPRRGLPQHSNTPTLHHSSPRGITSERPKNRGDYPRKRRIGKVGSLRALRGRSGTFPQRDRAGRRQETEVKPGANTDIIPGAPENACWGLLRGSPGGAVRTTRIPEEGLLLCLQGA